MEVENEDKDDKEVGTDENEKSNGMDMGDGGGRENGDEEGNDDEDDRSKETEKASDLMHMQEDEDENEEMEVENEDAPVPSNKYDAIYTHTLNSNIQSSREILMVKVIRALQEDQVTSSTFEKENPLYLIIQDCRSVHAASIQVQNSRKLSVPWFGLKWDDEKSRTIQVREEEKKRKERENDDSTVHNFLKSKTEMISHYMASVRKELEKTETNQCNSILKTSKRRYNKIIWTASDDLNGALPGRLITQPSDESCYYHSFLYFWLGRKPSDSEIRDLIGLVQHFLRSYGDVAYTSSGSTIKAHIEDMLKTDTMKVVGISRDAETGDLAEIDESRGLEELKILTYEEFIWLLEKPKCYYLDGSIVGWVLATLSKKTLFIDSVDDKYDSLTFRFNENSMMKFKEQV